jgi:hypothetical protein
MSAESEGQAAAAPAPRAPTHPRAQARIGRWWARIRRRAPHQAAPVLRVPDAVPGRAEARQPRSVGCELLIGAYVTDGHSLFRVEHTHTDPRTGRSFVELENCTTLELTAGPVDHPFARALRCVTPVGASQPGDAAAA